MQSVILWNGRGSGALFAPGAAELKLRATTPGDVELKLRSVRKHQKVEDQRYLYWADRIGLLVWEELPSAYRFTRKSLDRLMREWTQVIRRPGASRHQAGTSEESVCSPPALLARSSAVAEV